MSDARTQWLLQMQPYAQKVSAKTGIAPTLILARWAGETGWGQRTLPNSFNLGNVVETRSGVAGIAALDNGNPRRFRKFNSYDDYADFEAGMLQRKYQGALNTADPVKHFTALKAGGYAEAPNYVSHMAQGMVNAVQRRLGGKPMANEPSQIAPIVPTAPVAGSGTTASSFTVPTIQNATKPYTAPDPMAQYRLTQDELNAVAPLSAGSGALNTSIFAPIKV